MRRNAASSVSRSWNGCAPKRVSARTSRSRRRHRTDCAGWRLAARGLGVAVLPGLGSRPGLTTLPLADPRARGRVALVWRSEGPMLPAARELLGRLRRGMRAGAS
ncbi:LysR substrate-binding domain-containing protein [Streptomyces sp. RB17]|uniref:LysR substrate-binding domain-containing protein n=1 Tax=Streptomyces sp. RB17 TaxID=2585197 RepID=UPI003A4C7FFC